MLVIKKFYSNSCGPCKLIEPFLKEIEEQYKDVKVERYDAEQEDALVNQYGINSVPTLVFELNDNVMEKLVGFQPKMKICSVIDRLIG